MDSNALHARARTRGVNPVVYWLTRAVLQPFAHLFWRLSRIGREHIPAEGPVLLVCNHRSIIDPFIIGLCTRRPIYYVAKEEIFRHRLLGWFVSSLGAFPVRRGAADGDMIETAKAILERGDPVLCLREGPRTRAGPLGKPMRGVGRLALETGAPVVPVAMRGTETIRRGWRIRPSKIRVRIGAPLTFPRVETVTAQLAAAVTDRVWPNVMLQWEWLGGMAPLRRATVIGDGSVIAPTLERAGVDVEHATRDSEPDLSHRDVVVLAVPACELESVIAQHGPRIAEGTGVLVASSGLVAPRGTLPSEFVAQRTSGSAVGVLDVAPDGEAVMLASPDAAFARQVEMALRAARLPVKRRADMAGVELGRCARAAAALAAAKYAMDGPDAQVAAVGRVVAEIDAFARRIGTELETFTGVAGAADVAALTLTESDRPAEASTDVALLATRLRDAGVDAPALDELAGISEGHVAPSAPVRAA
jgi:1-acyl-sn-glycerol-3-phosphate acyltransferase